MAVKFKNQTRETLRSWFLALSDPRKSSSPLTEWEKEFLRKTKFRFDGQLQLSTVEQVKLEEIYAERTR